MKIYISGQITGLDYQEAFTLFESAEIKINANGNIAVNPMKSAGEVAGKKWIEYIVEDLVLLDDCDGIYMLSNWTKSDGARIEHAFSMIRNKAIFHQATK